MISNFLKKVYSFIKIFFRFNNRIIITSYKINKELIIKENNKYYNLIEFTIGNNNLSREEELIGLNHIDKTMYSEYLNYLLNKYLNIQKQSKNQNKKINEIINIIKNRVHN